eukprot:NODE_16531_length_989_cov_11.517401.p1 GENE.NODE_16531_length_989_cov_11.517401~~NODE_16531_length_989_cov_11.517401.p1  ORF type:complete len:223 (+),score=43.59 NODE_16531_length_989_cov_11.517401:27-695(+)
MYSAVSTQSTWDWEVRLIACEALRSLGQPAIAQASKVSRGLYDETYAIRSETCTLLLYLAAEEYIPQIAERLKDAVPTVRASAASALGGFRQLAEDYTDDICALLSDHSSIVKSAAIGALAAIGVEAYAGPIAQFIHDPNVDTRVAAILALPAFSVYGAAFMDEIAACTLDRVSSVRAAAASALSSFGKPAVEYYDVFVRALEDEDPRVADTASMALQALQK